MIEFGDRLSVDFEKAHTHSIMSVLRGVGPDDLGSRRDCEVGVSQAEMQANLFGSVEVEGRVHENAPTTHVPDDARDAPSACHDLDRLFYEGSGGRAHKPDLVSGTKTFRLDQFPGRRRIRNQATGCER